MEPGLIIPQMLSWGPNIVNILGTKPYVWCISMPDKIHSISKFTWTSLHRAIPGKPNILLATHLCFPSSVLT